MYFASSQTSRSKRRARLPATVDTSLGSKKTGEMGRCNGRYRTCHNARGMNTTFNLYECEKYLLVYTLLFLLQVTHWHSPRFHAYFPTGNSFPALIADMLSDAIACIGFSWVCNYFIENFLQWNCRVFKIIGIYCFLIVSMYVYRLQVLRAPNSKS